MDNFYTVIDTFKNHYDTILNFFVNRATNANAESFNAKVKAFRAQFRGVTDIPFFLYRLMSNHPILAVFHTNKQPLYVWQHIRVIGYLKFEGSIFVSSSSVISGRGLERASFIHLYGSMSASLQHATKV